MGLWARGPSAASLYEGLSKALFAATTDLRTVRLRESRTVRASARDPPGLAVAFLSELILLFQTEGFLGREVRVRCAERNGPSLEARLVGETFDPARHPRRIEVKAITLHALVFDAVRGRARVVVDI